MTRATWPATLLPSQADSFPFMLECATEARPDQDQTRQQERPAASNRKPLAQLAAAALVGPRVTKEHQGRDVDFSM